MSICWFFFFHPNSYIKLHKSYYSFNSYFFLQKARRPTKSELSTTLRAILVYGVRFSNLFVLTDSVLYILSIEHKIVIIGLDNAGKTTILYQFLMNEVVHTSPTIGSNVEEVVWNNIHFIMWDLGGQQSLRAAWSTYYCNTEVIIISNQIHYLNF